MQKLPIVGVMGSGSDPYRGLSQQVGTLVARLGCHLLTGGGGGVMAETAGAFVKTEGRKGSSIGIIKGEVREEALQNGGLGGLGGLRGLRRKFIPGTVNEAVEIPIYTHLPLSGADGKDYRSRNHINVLTADILVALPGGEGTFSEVMLRLEYGSDVILFLGEYTIAGKPASFFQEYGSEEYSSETGGTVRTAENGSQLEHLLKKMISSRY